MNSPTKILAYVPDEDKSLKAVKQAAWLARANGASITILRVLEGGVRWNLWKQRSDGPRSTELREVMESVSRVEIESSVEAFRTEDLDISVEIRWGTPWLEVTRAVMRDGYDLVIKAASGADAKRRPFMGSTALHLIRKCPCPVWIVGHIWIGSGGRILAAVDPSDEGTRPAHSQEILKWSMLLAGEDGELHAASAWRASGETLLSKSVPPDELDYYVKSSEYEARAGQALLMSSLGNPLDSERIHLLNGNPREVLPDFVQQEDFDLVVMGSIGRVGVAGMLIGETAETLIRSARVSVFTVKPPGFVSPVQLPVE